MFLSQCFSLLTLIKATVVVFTLPGGSKLPYSLVMIVW